MTLAERVTDALKETEGRDDLLREQLRRYRRFEAELARAGVVPSRDTYDIPLMSRLRRRSDPKARVKG